MDNSTKYIFTFIFFAILTNSCRDKTKPQLQFMPEMYESVAYEPYGKNSNLENGMASQKPVKGTVARGQIPYEYANTNEGYEIAKEELKSPLKSHELREEKGKVLYDIYCALCHGKKGDGQGYLVDREKFLGIPNYKDRDLTEGSIYHVIMYGRNLMGSHSSQLTYEERWQVVNYVQKLRADLLE